MVVGAVILQTCPSLAQKFHVVAVVTVVAAASSVLDPCSPPSPWTEEVPSAPPPQAVSTALASKVVRISIFG
jgi:hypothetical protein